MIIITMPVQKLAFDFHTKHPTKLTGFIYILVHVNMLCMQYFSIKFMSCTCIM